MSFLDNSGDIILDAVLTDHGRTQLAKGDGSFRISYFRLGDDEINYELYDKNHVSGGAYYDLEILQTPILEAMSNADVSLKSPLLTISNNEKLYMPVIRLNTLVNEHALATTTGSFHVACTFDSRELFTNNVGTGDGYSPVDGDSSLRADSGLDTNIISSRTPIDLVDRETGYLIQMDHRLGRLVDKGGLRATANSIDDDNIASYTLTEGVDSGFVTANTTFEPATNTEIIKGPRSTTLIFKILAAQELRDSNRLFNQLGGTTTFADHTTSATLQDVRFIDSTVRVTGIDTGYRLDIPVRYIKLTSE